MGRTTLIATAAFGLESQVAWEAESLGLKPSQVSPGQVWIEADEAAIAKLNVGLRSADRVQLVLGHFACTDFDALFEGVRAMPWANWITTRMAFPVSGRCVRSVLSSEPAVQRVANKAIAEALMTHHRVNSLPEDGPVAPVQVAIRHDEAILTLDTTGDGLFKRGYRPVTGLAPLKETLAAGLVGLSRWKGDRPLVDPCAGTGTIVIEAAMQALAIAPGLKRHFDSEAWPSLKSHVWKTARAAAEEAKAEAAPKAKDIVIWAGDWDAAATEAILANAERAGVAHVIKVLRRAAKGFPLPEGPGTLITNPPYGERIGEEKEIQELHDDLADLWRKHPHWGMWIFTPEPDVEAAFGYAPDRRRKLFNGRLEVQYRHWKGWRPEPPLKPASMGWSHSGQSEAE